MNTSLIIRSVVFVGTVLCVLGSPTKSRAQSTDAVGIELQRVNSMIEVAEAEDAKYSGGLVKSLIQTELHTLRQTRAMLEQRKTAKSVGTAIRYTVDGKPFVLPSGATQLLPEISREIESNKAKIAAAENEVSKYSGGLVLAMSLSTLATLRNTAAMLEQRKLAIQFELPQYIGAQPTQAPSAAATAPSSDGALPSRGPFQRAPATDSGSFEIVSVSSEVTEQNSTWWKYSYRVEVKNTGSTPIVVRATVEWLNAGGYIVDDDDSDATPIRPGETASITGYDLVTANVAGAIAKTSAKVGRVQ